MTEKGWKKLSNTLRYIGFVWAGLIFVVLTALTGYYSATRPHVPQSAYHWTVQLHWSVSPPSYGTAAEDDLLITLFWCGFYSVVPISLAEAIRIYKLDGWRKQ